MPQVAITRCPDYESKNLRRAIDKVLELMNGWESIFPPDSNILLKPNLLSARTPDKGVTTHPNFLKAVAESLIEYGVSVKIGDSPGGAHKGVERVFRNTGMLDVADELGIDIVNFETSGVHVIEKGRFKIHIARALDEFDAIVNLPRYKTHSYTRMTLSVKNMFGTVPGFQKAEYHKLYPNVRDFAEMLTEVYSHSKPAISIMDGIYGMEGEGPSSGDLRKDVGLVFASKDGVALDRVAEKIAGLKKATITTVLADKKDYGESNLKKIEILGGDLQDFILEKPFNFPFNTQIITRYLPNFIGRLIGKLIWIRPALHDDKCIECGKCMQMCPVDAIDMSKGLPEWDYDKCVLCLCCHEICPAKAIYLQRSLLAKRF